MKLMALLDELEQFVDNGKRLPLTEKLFVDGDQLLDYIDQIREALPEELEEAKRIYRDREWVLREARTEADQLMEQARHQMGRLVEGHEVTRQAQEMSEQIVEQAQRVSREIRQGANEYADDVLKNLEETLERTIGSFEKQLREIKAGREELRKMQVT